MKRGQIFILLPPSQEDHLALLSPKRVVVGACKVPIFLRNGGTGAQGGLVVVQPDASGDIGAFIELLSSFDFVQLVSVQLWEVWCPTLSRLSSLLYIPPPT